jgi:hypothetical protein
VAVSAFEVRPRPTDPTRLDALIQVFNASDIETKVSLSISGPNLRISKVFVVPVGETISQVIDVSEVKEGILRAEAKASGDALDTDNVAFALVTPHHARTVLLVTQGNPSLEESLRVLPGVHLVTTHPARYREDARYDAYVFDGPHSGELPQRGALLLGAAVRNASTVISKNVSVTDWDATDSLASGVAWRDLRIERAALISQAIAHERVIVQAKGSSKGGLIIASEEGMRRVRAGFNLSDSNFHLQPGFPVFLGHALDWLTSKTAPLTVNVGNVAIALKHARVFDEEGHPVPSIDGNNETRFVAQRPGVYRVKAQDNEVKIVANILDPAYAQINRSSLPIRDKSRAPRQPLNLVGISELWTALLVAACILLMIEWMTFTRRITQ